MKRLTKRDSENAPRTAASLREEVQSLPWLTKTKDGVVEEVYNMHYDSAGNLHWIGTKSGEHIVKKCCEYPIIICTDCWNAEVQE